MVGFMKRFLGHLGLWKEENNEKQQHQNDQNHHHQQQQQHQNQNQNQNHHYQPSVNNPVDTSKGFKMRMAVPTETATQGPVVYQCAKDGGVQGFRWYAQKLQADEDGDIAEEFLKEVLPDLRGHDNSRELPRLEVKHSTKPVTIKGPVVSMNGNVHQCVEHAGKVLWA